MCVCVCVCVCVCACVCARVVCVHTCMSGWTHLSTWFRLHVCLLNVSARTVTHVCVWVCVPIEIFQNKSVPIWNNIPQLKEFKSGIYLVLIYLILLNIYIGVKCIIECTFPLHESIVQLCESYRLWPHARYECPSALSVFLFDCGVTWRKLSTPPVSECSSDR